MSLLTNLIAAKAFYDFYDERQAYYRDNSRRNKNMKEEKSVGHASFLTRQLIKVES